MRIRALFYWSSSFEIFISKMRARDHKIRIRDYEPDPRKLETQKRDHDSDF